MSNKFMPPKPEFFDMYVEKIFDKWYDKEIRPLFENAMEVFNEHDQESWDQDKTSHCEKTALLINIKPIKEESAEDLLKEILTSNGFNFTPEWHARVKTYLERKK